ncbi:hypothetical protein [Methanocaldococcus sp.]
MKRDENKNRKNGDYFDKVKFWNKLKKMNKYELHRYYRNIVKGRYLGDLSLSRIERLKASEILLKIFEDEISEIIKEKLGCSRVFFDTNMIHDFMGIDAVTDFKDKIQIKITDKGNRDLESVLKISFSKPEYIKILLNDYHVDYYFKFIIEDAIEKPRIIAYLWCPMEHIKKNIDKFKKRSNKKGTEFYEATYKDLGLVIS